MSARRSRDVPSLATEPDWYKDAILYELHIRAFSDSDGDGRGDLRGLASRLDYLHQLGVTAIWLLPFYPSPLRDDGYDIADYTSIHPDLGTLADFRHFVAEAHRRNIRVVTELVLNHTSDQHPWFERARRSPPGSTWREFYVWSDTTDRYEDARIIFQDFEQSNWTWDPVAGQYYWHRFYSHQPDLNFRHEPVRRAVLKVVDFWLAMGVDGLRLDAVPYLYEAEGTDCENLPETHAYLQQLRAHIDANFPGRMLLAEANQWPEDAARYFGDDDECHMAFHFPLMPRLFMALRMEDRFPIVDIMQQTPEIPKHSQWALFLRNHDELTLEMVTDEERDYMYRAYARDPQMRVNLGIRRRLAPLLQFHRQKIELMYGLLLSLPGTPVLYYGDEIGMGDNVFLGDRNGVRTPMQWSSDRNAGFSEANPHRLYLPVNIDPECHYESVNVEAQLDNPDSLLRWVRRLVALRKRHRVFGRGSMEFVRSDNPSVLAFVRRDGNEQVLVVANLSRFAQYVELDLGRFQGMRPLELFGRTAFPAIGDLPYLVTLSPHAFYWFQLEATAGEEPGAERPLPELRVPAQWWQVLDGRQRRPLEAALPELLRSRRWFAGKHRRIQSVTIGERISLSGVGWRTEVLVVNVEFFEGEGEQYLLPLAVLWRDDAVALERDRPEAVLARVVGPSGTEGALFDGTYLSETSRAVLRLVAERRRRGLDAGARLVATSTPATAATLAQLAEDDELPARVGAAEQSNSSVVLGSPDGERVVMKVFRRLLPGENPELDVGRHLAGTDAPVARLLGAVELERPGVEATTVAVLHELVPHEADGWTATVRAAGAFLEQVLPSSESPVLPPPPRGGLLGALASGALPDDVGACLPDVVPAADLLGQRTAELHRALASGEQDAFRPEPTTGLSRRSLYQSMRNTARRSLVLLRQHLRDLTPENEALARDVLDHEDAILDRLTATLQVQGGLRARVHGDLHLGQILFTGRDYVFVDFEGEPARSFGERRLKRSVLTDVAGMLRSYHYAAHTAVAEAAQRGVLEEADGVTVDGAGPVPPPAGAHGVLTPAHYRDAADRFAFWVGTSFLAGYLEAAEGSGLLPDDPDGLAALLGAQLLDKALYELRYELANRPEWVHLPLLGLRFLLGSIGTPPGREPGR
ncbi:MAG: maltose alpha-D-glucosyltransferase [Actinomycetota bacterium]|nr:maltose alpha-D-glucosyltransferase [Actinomycetota bacterium]